MRQHITESHFTDPDSGAPTGGETKGVGIHIVWQNGPLGRGDERMEPNGAFVEGVIQAVVGRLRYYQRSAFMCRENALALTKLEEAIHWCQHRTEARESQGVKGTHELHKG